MLRTAYRVRVRLSADDPTEREIYYYRLPDDTPFRPGPSFIQPLDWGVKQAGVIGEVPGTKRYYHGRARLPIRPGDPWFGAPEVWRRGGRPGDPHFQVGPNGMPTFLQHQGNPGRGGGQLHQGGALVPQLGHGGGGAGGAGLFVSVGRGGAATGGRALFPYLATAGAGGGGAALVVLLGSGGAFGSGEGEVDMSVPAGTIIAYGGATLPSGYLECDGTSYSTGTHPALFSAIGYTWGGSGANFNVPDLRGRVPIGVGTGPGLTTRNLGTNYGAETVTLGIGEIPSHTHTISGGVLGAGTGVQAGASMGFSAGTPTGSAGAGGAHANVQPSAGVRWIIKT